MRFGQLTVTVSGHLKGGVFRLEYRWRFSAIGSKRASGKGRKQDVRLKRITIPTDSAF